MKPVSIQQLILKGTHNSYACHGNTPCVNHPPVKQIDDFGVWYLELDIGFIREDGQLIGVLGHEAPGDAVCWGDGAIHGLPSPHGYLEMIKTAASLQYRPLVIFIEWKLHIDDWDNDCPNNDCVGYGRKLCEDVFGQGNVLGRDEAIEKSVPELAGKVILDNNDLPARFDPDCTNKATVEGWFKEDPALILFRIDQYQGDWTYDIGVPPNPLVVDWEASPPWTVTDSEGDGWFCLDTGDSWKGQVVHEQGTYRFPYKTVGRAVQRAQGITPTGDPSLLTRRTGYGWTMLIKPGNYPETLTIDVPLTLKKDDRFDGTVIIGK